MSKHLVRDLDALQQHVLRMAGRVEEAVFRATKALRDRDPALAAEVVAGDAAVDALENTLQEDCLKVLALHQPVAADLRQVAAVIGITTDLERIGDLAVDIADRAAALARDREFPVPDRVERLADLATGLLRQALDAFVNLDTTLARRVIRLDDEVDRVYAEVAAELTARMKADPAAVEPGLSLFEVAKHLERIGDHATNLAEDVVYLVEGEVLRHRPMN
jgi:phosphate transport system protein